MNQIRLFYILLLMILCTFTVNAQSIQNLRVSPQFSYRTGQYVRIKKIKFSDIVISGNTKDFANKKITVNLDLYDWTNICGINDKPKHYQQIIKVYTNTSVINQKITLYPEVFNIKEYGDYPFIFVAYVTCDSVQVLDETTGKYERFQSEFSKPAFCLISRKINELTAAGSSLEMVTVLAEQKLNKHNAALEYRRAISELNKNLNKINFDHPDYIINIEDCLECNHSGKCSKCNGKAIWYEKTSCSACGGRGLIYSGDQCNQCGGSGRFEIKHICNKCYGSGLCNYCQWQNIDAYLKAKKRRNGSTLNALFGGLMNSEEINLLNNILR